MKRIQVRDRNSPPMTGSNRKVSLQAALRAVHKAGHLSWGVQLGSPLWYEKMQEIFDNLQDKSQ